MARMDANHATESRGAASTRNVGPKCSSGRNSFASAFPADITDEVVSQVSGTPENARGETKLAWHSSELGGGYWTTFFSVLTVCGLAV